jgi:hypothetical protein
MSLSVFGCKGKYLENNFPSRLYKLGLLVAESCHAHHDIFLNFFLSGVKVVEHYSFEGFQEHFLVAEVLSLFFLEEFVCQLPKRIDGVDDDM